MLRYVRALQPRVMSDCFTDIFGGVNALKWRRTLLITLSKHTLAGIIITWIGRTNRSSYCHRQARKTVFA